MKPYQSQRQTKKRAKGLRAGDFIARHFGAFKEEPQAIFEDAWPVSQLFHADYDLEQDGLGYDGILSWCMLSLSKSPSAYMLIKEAVSQDWHIGIKDLDGQDFHLDVPDRVLYLDDQSMTPRALAGSPYFLNILRISMIRAFRDIWQEVRHGGFDEDFSPDNVLLMERIRAADCDVLSILVGWEMRSEGENDLWRYLIGSEEGDMAMTFSGTLEREPASQFNGRALAAAFNQWFKNEERVNSCDHETLNYMDDVMQDYPVGNPFGDRKPTRIGVEILSCLPDKTAYLRGMGDEILSDPLYAGLQDDINQSHFLQIMHDIKVTYVEGVPFRDTMLAERIFPEGFELSGEETIH